MNTSTRKLIAALAVVALITIAGCGAEGSNQGQELANDTGQNISGVQVGESYSYEIALTEKNQYGLVKAQPPFIMERSLERANLIRRYQYLNDRNNVHHVYLMSETGQVVSYYVAQGKVSSVNSKLTNNQQIVASNRCLKRVDFEGQEANCFKAVESPQMDGSYGTNGDAIFFFTPSGHYVEWNGVYLVSEEPKNIQSSVMLVDKAGDSGPDAPTANTTNASA